MNGLESMAKLLVTLGLFLAFLGGLVGLLSRARFFGNLPGDIRVARDGVTCLIPLASSIILSLLLTLVLNLIGRLINR